MIVDCFVLLRTPRNDEKGYNCFVALLSRNDEGGTHMLYLFSKKMVTFPVIASEAWQSILCKNNIVNNKPNCFLIYIFGLFYVVFWIASFCHA
jgi:hypothetical protein